MVHRRIKVIHFKLIGYGRSVESLWKFVLKLTGAILQYRRIVFSSSSNGQVSLSAFLHNIIESRYSQLGKSAFLIINLKLIGCH